TPAVAACGGPTPVRSVAAESPRTPPPRREPPPSRQRSRAGSLRHARSLPRRRRRARPTRSPVPTMEPATCCHRPWKSDPCTWPRITSVLSARAPSALSHTYLSRSAGPAATLPWGAGDQVGGTAEHLVPHGPGQPSGVGVLAAGVIGAQQNGPGGKSGFRAVGEARTLARGKPLPPARGAEPGVVGDVAQHQHDGHAFQQAQLGSQVVAAMLELERRRTIAGRGAAGRS